MMQHTYTEKYYVSERTHLIHYILYKKYVLFTYLRGSGLKLKIFNLADCYVYVAYYSSEHE